VSTILTYLVHQDIISFDGATLESTTKQIVGQFEGSHWDDDRDGEKPSDADEELVSPISEVSDPPLSPTALLSRARVLR
jgi:hypothetical protein